VGAAGTTWALAGNQRRQGLDRGGTFSPVTMMP
jgi:hypothetical protein